jgi:hypothetical protein
MDRPTGERSVGPQGPADLDRGAGEASSDAANLA